MHLYFDQNNKLVFDQVNNGIVDLNGIDYDAASLISRMIATGETPTAARQVSINNCILSLKYYNLWSNQFDVLVVTRGHGPNSTKLNWIKNSSNAMGVLSGGTLTFTTDVGYNGDGVKSYIDTNFIPSAHGVLFTLNSGCFGFKNSGTRSNNTGHGVNGGTGNGYTYMFASAGYNKVNSSQDYGGTEVYSIGYNCVSRFTSTQINVMINGVSTTRTQGSMIKSNHSIWMLAINTSNTYTYGTAQTEKLEAYWMGRDLSPSRYLIFQSIMNAYFAAF
jgi:hypothetical protein